MARCIKHMEDYEKVEDWLESSMYERLKTTVGKFPGFLHDPYKYMNLERDIIIAEIIKQFPDFLHQHNIDLLDLEIVWRNLSKESCRTGIAQKIKYVNLDCASASSGYSLESKVSTTNIPNFYIKGQRPEIQLREKFALDENLSKQDWIRVFVNNIFNIQFEAFVKNHTSVTDDKTAVDKFKAALASHISAGEIKFLELHYNNLLEEAAVQIAFRKPRDVRAYLGHYILTRMYCENFKDLNVRDIEYLVKLREYRVCSDLPSDQIHKRYLCNLLNDEKLVQSKEVKYKFQVNGKIRLLRGKRLSPKIKKITQLLSEKDPIFGVSKKIRSENLYKEIANELNRLTYVLREEVGLIKKDEMISVYDSLTEIVKVISPKFEAFCKINANKPKSAQEIAHNYSYTTAERISKILSYSCGNGMQKSSRSLHSFANSSSKLPDITNSNTCKAELDDDMAKLFKSSFRNNITFDDKCNLITKVEEFMKEKEHNMQGVRKFERELICDDLRNILHIIQKQYQSAVEDPENEDECLMNEVIPMLKSVLQFENETQECIVIDQIKEYLQQMVRNQKEERIKNKENILKIAKASLRKVSKSFANKTKAVSKYSSDHSFFCKADNREHFNQNADHKITNLLHSISKIFEEIELNQQVLIDLVDAAKDMILMAPKMETEHNLEVLTDKLGLVER